MAIGLTVYAQQQLCNLRWEPLPISYYSMGTFVIIVSQATCLGSALCILFRI